MADVDRSATGENATKRRRVAVACQPCRDRKSKCDGETPVCSTCDQIGSLCSYPSSLSKHDQLRQEFTTVISDLSRRMAEMERALARSERGSIHSQHASTEPSVSPSRQSVPDSGASPTANGSITISEDAFQANYQPDKSADGSAIIPLASREDCAFFGPSSNIAFLRLVSRAMAKVSGPPPKSTEQRDEGDDRVTLRPHAFNSNQRALASSSTTSEYKRQGRERSTFEIPADNKVKEMIDAYYTGCGTIHPYIHCGRLLETYEEFRRSNFTRVRRSWLALFYTILALAACSWRAPADNDEAEYWFGLGSDLCLKQIFSGNSANLETVQTLLSMVMYLQGTQDSMRMVVLHGMAVKIAYQLGLHSVATSNSLDPIESEIRKRTWSGLVFYDRTFCVSFGRPAETSSSRSTLPQPRPYADSAQRGLLRPDEASVSFLRSNLDLYEIIHQTVQSLYDGNSGSRPDFSLDSISKAYALEAELLKWKASLPPSHAVLECIDSSIDVAQISGDAAMADLKRRTIMTLRYLHARALIHRPLLEGLLEAILQDRVDAAHAMMMKQAGGNSISTIVSCAVRLVGIVHPLVSSRDEGYKQLGAWWGSIYLTFNAALAILGSFLASSLIRGPEILAQSAREAASEALRQSLGVMDALNDGHPTVSRCRAYLQELVRAAAPFQPQSSASSGEIDQLRSRNMAEDDSSARGQPGAHPNGHNHGNTAFTGQTSTVDLGISPFHQLASDVDFQNYLFPLDLQLFGDQFNGIDQPLI